MDGVNSYYLFLQDTSLWSSLSRYFLYVYSSIVLFPSRWGTLFVNLLTPFIGDLPLIYLRCLACDNFSLLKRTIPIFFSLLYLLLKTSYQPAVKMLFYKSLTFSMDDITDIPYFIILGYPWDIIGQDNKVCACYWCGRWSSGSPWDYCAGGFRSLLFHMVSCWH